MLNLSKISAACVKEIAEKSTNKILSRLAQKLKSQSDNFMVGYSRMHNRHNRS